MNTLAKYHHYEFASAAFQIGIVLASATVITGMVVLSYLAGGLGVHRARLHGVWAVRAARRCICTERDASRPCSARMRRRMRHNSRNARPDCFGAEDAEQSL